MLIAHASQSADPQEPAFVHAVGFAASSGARLVSLHVAQGTQSEPPLPEAGALLQRWGLPAERVSHQRRMPQCCDDVADTLVDALRPLEPDLVVLSTHARTGLSRLFSGSIAEGVARNLGCPTLLLPAGARPLVDARSGAVDLHRMLVFSGSQPDTQLGVDAAVALARLAGQAGAELVLAHVDDGHLAPSPTLPQGFVAMPKLLSGGLEDAIVQCAQDTDACAVVMVSRGHDTALDVLLSSHTERVLHALHRSLLWVPAQWKPSA